MKSMPGVGAALIAMMLPLGVVGGEAPTEETCFNKNQIRHFEVIDDYHVVVNLTHDRQYLVELRRPRSQLDRLRAAHVESETAQVCARFSKIAGRRIESIRALDVEEYQQLTAGPDDEPAQGD